MLGNFPQTIAIIWLVKSEKSKPVEKRGRKAKGLKSPSWDDDSQVAEDGIDFFFASLVQNQALFVEILHSSSDKGKPVEKRGRKAKDLKSRPRDHDSQVAEARSSLGNLSVFIEEEKK